MTKKEFKKRFEKVFRIMKRHRWEPYSCYYIQNFISARAMGFYNSEFRFGFSLSGLWIDNEVRNRPHWDHPEDVLYLRMILVQMFYEVSIQEGWYKKY